MAILGHCDGLLAVSESHRAEIVIRRRASLPLKSPLASPQQPTTFFWHSPACASTPVDDPMASQASDRAQDEAATTRSCQQTPSPSHPASPTPTPVHVTNPKTLLNKVPAVNTGCPNATNTAQWFYKPYLQPSCISTTATSSLMPTTPIPVSPSPSHPSPSHFNSPLMDSDLVAGPESCIDLFNTGTTGALGGFGKKKNFDDTADTHYAHLLPSRSAARPALGSVAAALQSERLSALHGHRTTGPYSTSAPRATSFHSNNSPPPYAGTMPSSIPLSSTGNPTTAAGTPVEAEYHSPYKAPSHTNSRAFIPPTLQGYEVTGGSQAGNMGLIMGKRLSDGIPVTGKVHQSRVILQHEYRILKRLEIVNTKFNPDYNIECQSDSGNSSSNSSDSQSPSVLPEVIVHTPVGQMEKENAEMDIDSHLKKGPTKGCQHNGPDKASSQNPRLEPGGDESEKYFNRIVEDFIDVENEDMSVLVLERLGANLLSHLHHQFLGLDDVDGLHCPETQPKQSLGSPFPDVYTFLVFALKASSVLEALLGANLAHLAICPTAMHWMPPKRVSQSASTQEPSSPHSPEPSPKHHPNNTDNTTVNNTEEGGGTPSSHQQFYKPPPPPSHLAHLKPNVKVFSLLEGLDVNETSIRLFDFTHSKILSHERARAPNNIAEWQIPSFLEYHLHFLAPEQTGRAETWMDHRTDIYCLGTTLFTLLTMQFPNAGNDSVQILQGVLTRDLPSLNVFRPDMPPIIDDILRKMTQKQPSQRYQSAFGFKQDILHCLNELHKTGWIDSFELGRHDHSYRFVLPNLLFGRQSEQQLISSIISQAANAYQNWINSEQTMSDDESDHGRNLTSKTTAAAAGDLDLNVLAMDIVPLQNQASAKIPLSSKMLLRNPKPFDGGRFLQQGSHGQSEPVVRVIFVGGSSGVGNRSVLVRGMSTAARNTGLFAAGVFEAEGSAPYSAILSCIQSVLQQLLAQHTEALASLFVAIRTAFEPDCGISIVCDLVPELRFFFHGTEMPESKDVPLVQSMVRFHNLIVKLIRVISTHFFMTWLMDDLQFADDNSVELLATLVNANKRLPVVLIITHRETKDCLAKIQSILGGGSTATGNPNSSSPADNTSSHNGTEAANAPTSQPGSGDASVDKSEGIPDTRASATGSSSTDDCANTETLPMVGRGGAGVRFIRLLDPTLESIQDFLATIYYDLKNRVWNWSENEEALGELIRKLTGEEYSFLSSRFRALDPDTRRTLICASVCGPIFKIQDLQYLASAWTEKEVRTTEESGIDKTGRPTWQSTADIPSTATPTDIPITLGASTASASINKGFSAMAGLQNAIKEGILVYTSVPDQLRFHHGVMRKVALSLLDNAEETERLHYEMAKTLYSIPGQEFRTANHILQCLNLIQARFGPSALRSEDEKQTQEQGGKSEPHPDGDSIMKDETGSENDEGNSMHDTESTGTCRIDELDLRSLRKILSLAGEKSQKSGAQDMALAYWRAALSMLPKNCWEQRSEDTGASSQYLDFEDSNASSNTDETNQQDRPCSHMTDSSPATSTLQGSIQNLHAKQLPLYYEALKLHLQCIEAERWQENFDQAMEICGIVLANVTDPIDRARVYQHQIEMYVWAFSSPSQATTVALQCLGELGIPKDANFNPSDKETRALFDQTHALLLERLPFLSASPPKYCTDPRIAMIMEVFSVSCASFYYCNVPFMASSLAYANRLTCEHGITKDSGRALVSFILTHSTRYEVLDHAYELGRLALSIAKNNQHVTFLFYMTVQQWGDHIINAITSLEETLTAVDLTCDRLFHTAGMMHVSVMRLLLGRAHLNDCMSSTSDMLGKPTEFGPKSHGIKVMQGVIQMIKCLKGQTLASDPETIFDDLEVADPKLQGRKEKMRTNMIINNSTYLMLKVVAAFVFGHYKYVCETTYSWHDDPKSIMNFESSWIAHSIFTVVGLSLAIVLRTEQDPEVRQQLTRRLFKLRGRMRLRAEKFPTNHASMYYLLEAEIADQELVDESSMESDDDNTLDHRRTNESVKDVSKVLLLFEKSIQIATEGDFPLHKCFAYELTAKCHLRYGLVTSARCLMASACKAYQVWGAKGKVQWIYHTYPKMLPANPENEPTGITKELFYRPNDNNGYPTNCPLSSVGRKAPTKIGNGNPTVVPPVRTSPWMANMSPNVLYSPAGFGCSEALSAAAAAMAESCMASTSLYSQPQPLPTSTSTMITPLGAMAVPGSIPTPTSGNGSTMAPSFSSSSSSSSSASLSSATSVACSSALHGPLYAIHNGWIGSPQSPEIDSADLDVLDFSSVIEAMQVVASEIDMDRLLVKSLLVLNQSVGAKRCCIIISKDQEELVLSASLGDSGNCEAVNPPLEVNQCKELFHGVINYVVNTSSLCLLTNAKDDPRFCADEYLKQRTDLKTVLCAPIVHKSALVGVLYMEEFPERAFANRRMLVMNLLVQQLGISITNALLYLSVLDSESKLNGLLENMPCGIALWDANAEVCQYINSSWKDMTGFTVDEIMTSKWSLLVHPDERIGHGIAWRDRVRVGVPCKWESRYGLKDGTFRWAIVRMLPIKASFGDREKITQWLTVTIDIDDQRRAVQLKSNFLANMSHELRTPFSGILGMLSLLRDSSGLSHEQFEFVDMAKASCEMLIRIVDDLLNFSKLEADKVTLEHIPMCFEEILGDVCDLLVPLASKKGLELIILVDEALPLLLIGDPDRTKQILMNLIGNAIKFSSSGNVVVKYWHEINKRETLGKYRSKQLSQKAHDVLTQKLGPQYKNPGTKTQSIGEDGPMGDDSHLGDEVVLHCSVSDPGIGMSPEEQQMLFVSFQQTDSGTTRKYGGTGLGLSICAQLIKHMDGDIHVESEKGKGSNFTFFAKLRTMTRHDSALNPEETARIIECNKVLKQRCETLKSKRILVLSPNKDLREQIVRTVAGSEVMEFEDVRSAVESGAIGVSENPFGEPCNTGHFDKPGVTVALNKLDRLDSSLALLKEVPKERGDEATKCEDGECPNITPRSLSTIRQFDFILVDHVLDSAELDFIYPSPSVAFVLLLAPTTDTLRWILPPAVKQEEDDDEGFSKQVDVGGRHRSRQKESGQSLVDRTVGHDGRSSCLSKDGNDNGPETLTNKGLNTHVMVPSQLFKRRKMSLAGGSISSSQNGSLKRSRNHDEEEKAPASATGSRRASGSTNLTAIAPFQVCRMIKPVRRLKLLQIMCNALLRHEQGPIPDEGVDMDIDEKASDTADDNEEEAASNAHNSMSESQARSGIANPEQSADRTTRERSVSNPSLELETAEDQDDSSRVRKRAKTSQHSGLDDERCDLETEKDEAKASMEKVKTIGRQTRDTKKERRPRSSDDIHEESTNANYPKRARNNDALTLLLTPEERRRCRGVNVLVAEDDFVSQKILEKQLSKLGMNVKIANNGQEAVNQWLAVERGFYTIAIFDH
ncbi:histidine kinase osmosensor, partial [Lunasporangiospora selenospora]